MARQVILASDTLPASRPKVNENFEELYDRRFVAWSYADAAARDAATYTSDDIGFIARVASPLGFWRLRAVTPSLDWERVGGALEAHTHALSDLTASGATTGQVPQWSGSAWVPATVSGGGGLSEPLDAPEWEIRTSRPITPSAGRVRKYLRKIATWAIPCTLDEHGRERIMMPTIEEGAAIVRLRETNFDNIGVHSAHFSTSLNAAFIGTTLAQEQAIGASVSIGGRSVYLSPPATGDFLLWAIIQLPDSSYSNTWHILAALRNGSSVTGGSAADPVIGIGFGPSVRSNWRLHVHDGTVATYVDFGHAPVSSSPYLIACGRRGTTSHGSVIRLDTGQQWDVSHSSAPGWLAELGWLGGNAGSSTMTSRISVIGYYGEMV